MKKKKSVKELLDEGKSVKLFCLCGAGGKVEAGDVVNAIKRKGQYSMYGSGHVFIDFDENILSNFILLDEVPKAGEKVLSLYDTEMYSEVSFPCLFWKTKKESIQVRFKRHEKYEADSLGKVRNDYGLTVPFHPDYFLRIPAEYDKNYFTNNSEYFCIEDGDGFLSGLKYYTDGSGNILDRTGIRRGASIGNFVKTGEYDGHIMPIGGEYYRCIEGFGDFNSDMIYHSSIDGYITGDNYNEVGFNPSLLFACRFEYYPTPKKGEYYEMTTPASDACLFTVGNVYLCVEDKFLLDDQGGESGFQGDLFGKTFTKTTNMIGYTKFYEQINNKFADLKLGEEYVFVLITSLEDFYSGTFRSEVLCDINTPCRLINLGGEWYNREKVLILGYGDCKG